MANIRLRSVTKDDMQLLYDWRNDEVVRQNSFNKDIIPWENHQKWFMNMLSNLNEHAYILMDEDEAIGQVRLSVDGDEAEITYSIEEQYRYLEYGKIILQLVENVVASEMPDVKLVAKVKSDNVASQHIFEKLGYEIEYVAYKKIPKKSNVHVLKSGGDLFLSNN